MLYSSYIYIFIFLPVVIVGFFVAGKRMGQRAALFWLMLASFFFYGYWNPKYLPLLFFSIALNLYLGIKLARRHSKSLLVFGLFLNLALLCFFKFTDFIIVNLNQMGLQLSTLDLVLPIGISFFTFQQVAFLVGSYRSGDMDYDPLRYGLFVSLFCQLVSGPIVYQENLSPQFKRDTLFQVDYQNISEGIYLFAMGMAKKTVADIFVEWTVLHRADWLNVSFFGAWLTTLCYAIRIYFDFSGYIDMARGSARMINIDLPINFNTPYRAVNFRDFWRRWNITLSIFLRDYIYIPLGGNRRAISGVMFNLMVTMVLAGIWHGAGWGFILWGALHGFFLCINHLIDKWGIRIPKAIGWTTTFICVVFAWGLFKSTNTQEAFDVAGAMLGLYGIDIPVPTALLNWLQVHGVSAWLSENIGLSIVHIGELSGYYGKWPIVALIVAFIFSILGPNSDELARSFQPTRLKMVTASGMFVLSVLFLHYVKDFVYFQF